MHHLVHGFACHLRLACAHWCGGATTAVVTARFAALGTLNTKGAAAELFAVELLDDCIGNLGVVNVGETETCLLYTSDAADE